MKNKRYVIGNWKMNTTLPDAMVLATGIKDFAHEFNNIGIVICPPFTWLYPIAEAFRHKPSNLSIGAQNMYWQEKGAYTGEISPLMLKGMLDYVILGHSERRYIFEEDDENINEKVKSAISYRLRPVLCVGEKTKKSAIEGKNGIISQVENGLEGVDKNDIGKVIIAYEPVWAIGTGDAATGEYAADIIMKIRKKIAGLYDDEIALKIPILYGGSVTKDNIEEFMFETEINGVLAGGSSLKIGEFKHICKVVNQYR